MFEHLLNNFFRTIVLHTDEKYNAVPLFHTSLLGLAGLIEILVNR